MFWAGACLPCQDHPHRLAGKKRAVPSFRNGAQFIAQLSTCGLYQQALQLSGSGDHLGFHAVPQLLGLVPLAGADHPGDGAAGAAEAVAQAGHAQQAGEVLPGEHGLEHRGRGDRGTLAPLGLELGGIGLAPPLQKEQVQGDLHPEVGGTLLHPVVDDRVNGVIQHLVEDIARGETAGGGASCANGPAQVGQRFLPPPLVETVGDLLGQEGENQRVRTIQAQLKRLLVVGTEFLQVCGKLIQHLLTEVGMGVVIRQRHHLPFTVSIRLFAVRIYGKL